MPHLLARILTVLVFLAQVSCLSSKPGTTADLSLPNDAYAGVYGEHGGAAATVNPLATRAALQAFDEGGNAIDAALAAAFTLGVVDSHNSGIGGGCFVLARLQDGRVIAIDGREKAPMAATSDMYLVDGEVQTEWSKTGALASGIPGSVAAYHELQSRFGKLDFPQVLLPAADLAERGFAIDRTMALRLQSTSAKLKMFPATAAIFLPQGQTLQAGNRLVQRDLAESYRKLAAEGPGWFYRGEFAKGTAEWMRDNGGIITERDFGGYQIVYRQPVKSQFRGFSLYGFPPPSSGGVHVAQILNILENFDLLGASVEQRYHLTAEAMRKAFADRAYWLGDPDYVDVPMNLASSTYAAELAAGIDSQRAAAEVSHGVPPDATQTLFDKHTTHIATADAQGNWVAITTTLNTSFGAKVVIPGTGVLMNNQMDDFSAQPGVANAFGLVGSGANTIAPGKRPLSSMSPTYVEHAGVPFMTLGAAGGPTIISQVVQVLIQRLALNQPLPEAMAYPRIHHQWRPDFIFAEPGLSETVVSELVGKGHTVKQLGSFGGTQAIERDAHGFVAVTEPRVIERNSQTVDQK